MRSRARRRLVLSVVLGALAVAAAVGLVAGAAHWRATGDGLAGLSRAERVAGEEALRRARYYCVTFAHDRAVPHLWPTRALRVKFVRKVPPADLDADTAGALWGYEVRVEAQTFFAVRLGEITLRDGGVNCYGGPAL